MIFLFFEIIFQRVFLLNYIKMENIVYKWSGQINTTVKFA